MTEGEGPREIIPAAVIAPAGNEPPLSAAALAAVNAGMPEETRRAYERDWREFTKWCAENDRAALPASADTLTEYVTWLCYSRPCRDGHGHVIPGRTGLSPSSVSRARWAVLKAHELAQAPPPHGKPALMVIKGYKRALAESRDPRARARKAAAATPETVRELITTGLRGAQELIVLRDRAMFLLNYACSMRVSEIVRVNIEDVEEVPAGLLITPHRIKTGTYKPVAIPAETSPETITAILKWIAVLKRHERVTGPLFPRISKSGVIGAPAHGGTGKTGDPSPSGDPEGRMTPFRAANRVKLAAEEAGLNGKWTPHSFRRGFATQAALAGHDRLRIARHGGWSDSSRALDGYIEDADKWRHNPLRNIGI